MRAIEIIRRAIDRRVAAQPSSCRSASCTGRSISSNIVSGMFREAIEKMTAYKPGEQPRPGERLIKLNTNENPYPPSPRVRRAVVRVAADSLRLYPAPRADDFVASASKLYGVRKDMILAGNGSDELLAMIFRATLGPGDTVAYPVPTYSLYDTLASIQEARVLRFPVEGDFSIPLDKARQARAKLTIVCSPNSPSGILTPTAKLAKLARALRDRLLVIDEAYVDFASENAIGLLRRFPNVVILRTLSKSFSLAGMRLGLCFARPEIIEELMKVKDSYNLSRIALAAGAEALERRGLDAAQRRAREAHARSQYRAAAQDGIRGAGLVGEFRARADGRPRPRAAGARDSQERHPGAAFCHADAARCDSDFDRHAGRNECTVQSDRGESSDAESQRRGASSSRKALDEHQESVRRLPPRTEREERGGVRSGSASRDAMGSRGARQSRRGILALAAQRGISRDGAHREIKTCAVRSPQVQRPDRRGRARRSRARCWSSRRPTTTAAANVSPRCSATTRFRRRA